MKFKKALAATMAVTMVMASAMTVCAADKYPNLKIANQNVLVAGDENATSVAGDYSTEYVRGVAVLTPFQDVKASLGLTENQRPTVVVYDAEQKSSPEAFACLDAAVQDLGATEVASIYFELGAKENGKWITPAASTTVTVKAGLPKNADKTKTYHVVRVQENGVVTVLEDLDNSNKTVTFEAVSGVGTYGIVTDVTNTAALTTAAVETAETEAAETTETAAVETTAAAAETETTETAE